MDVGYLRVSSFSQNTERQLEGVSLGKIFTDHGSGRDTERSELKRCLEFVREGDVLHVHSIDRLARNLKDLLDLLSSLTKRGVTVKFHKEALTFSGEDSPFQRLHLQIVGAVAEFERALIRERQQEGIEIAKRDGRYKGRKRMLSDTDLKAVRERLNAGESVSVLAKEFGVTRKTVYRWRSFTYLQ